MGLFSSLFGKKVNSKDLQQHQTAESVMLKREFAQHPSKGLTPAKLATILQNAEQGYLLSQAELFMDMEEKDAHIQAEMHKRKMAVTVLDWTLQPPHDASDAEKKATALLEDRIRDMLDVEDMLFDALDAIGHGYSCLELEWKRDSTGWFPEVEHRSPSWFTFNPEHPNHIRLRSNENLYGDALQDFGWIAHKHKSRSGYLVRSGLHRSLIWPYLFKNYSVADLAEMLEIYGLPIRIGKYAPGASENEKKTLMQAIINMGHNAGGIIPDSMQMEFITATSSGSSDPFKAMIDWCEASQSKAILGNALSTMDSKGGSQALGTVHNEVRLDIRNNDARQLATTLSGYLIYPVCMLNGLFANDRCPTWQFDTQEADDLALYADALPKLASAGAEIPLRYVNDKLKIPARENGEPILGQNAPPPAVKGLAAAAQDTQDPTSTDSQTQQLAKETAKNQNDWIAALKVKVDKADSLESLRDDLLNSYGDLETDKLSNIMALALASAELSGRFDVQQPIT